MEGDSYWSVAEIKRPCEDGVVVDSTALRFDGVNLVGGGGAARFAGRGRAGRIGSSVSIDFRGLEEVGFED